MTEKQQKKNRFLALFYELSVFLTSYPKYILMIILFTFLPIIIGISVFFTLTLTLPVYKTPQLIGLSILDAAAVIQKNHLNIRIIPQNSTTTPRYFVINQDIKAGEKIKEGREIILYISSGALSSKFPSYIGKDIYKVQTLLNHIDNNFKPMSIAQINWVDSDKPFGTIIEQSPQSAKYQEYPVSVTFAVSNGSSNLMPNLQNKYLLSALYELYKKNIKVSIQTKKAESSQSDGKVIDQYPKANTPLIQIDHAELTVASYHNTNTRYISYIVPEELNKKNIRIILTDQKGRKILFEAQVAQGDILLESPMIFGNYSIGVYTVENKTENLYEMLKI